MKLHILIPAVLSFAAAPGLASCSSTGQDKAESTAMTMGELRSSIVTTKENLTAAAASLATVVDKAEEDPKPPFKQYGKDVAALESSFKSAQSQVKTIQAKGNEYFTAWKKQAETLNDPDLKARAEERREKLSKAIEEIVSTMTDASTDLQACMATIKDMHTYLSNDLTPDGISSVKDKSKQVSKDASSVGKKLDEVLEVLEKGETAFKTARPPAPAPEEKKG